MWRNLEVLGFGAEVWVGVRRRGREEERGRKRGGCGDRAEGNETEGGQIVRVCVGMHWVTCGRHVQAGG